jgi:predicted acylesterase/phospholipase RssA
VTISSLQGKGLGYALSGGGARGYAQVGMLKVLEENGVYPQYVTGVSIGSIVGGLYSMGYSAAEVESLMLDLNMPSLLNDRYRRYDLEQQNKRYPSYGNLIMNIDQHWIPDLPKGITYGNKMNLKLAQMFMSGSAVNDFSQLPIQYSTLSTDLINGQQVIMKSGSLFRAVRSSVSLPVFISPYQYNGHLYFDGGLLQNMPIPQTFELGADAVIALKVNTRLRPDKGMGNALTIMDRSINIGMTQKVMEHLNECDLLLEPNLKNYAATSYKYGSNIIALGESYARANADRIIAFRDSLIKAGYAFTKPEKLPALDIVPVTEIVCRDNEFIGSDLIQKYLRLKAGNSYTPEQIISACDAVWHTQLFAAVYPVLEPMEAGYRLVVYARELDKRHLVLNFTYSNTERLNIAATLTLNNLPWKSSSLRGGFILGGRTELNLDYTQTFGTFSGMYARLYPYLKGNRFYTYDESINRTGSYRALEYGATAGLGVFANRIATAEAFIYSYRQSLARDITGAALNDSLFLISGYGVKAYREALDDDVLPQKGYCVFAKLNIAPLSKISDRTYQRMYSEADVYPRLANFLSMHFGVRYGAYYTGLPDSSYASEPFYYSGYSGYKARPKYASNSAQFVLGTIAAVLRPGMGLNLETGVQAVNPDTPENWSQNNTQLCFFGDLGYRSPLGPIHFTVAASRESKPSYYFSLGYDIDQFWFSRR